MKSLRKQLSVSVTNEGRVTFIYDDVLADLISEGNADITRVSYVEPSEKGWTAMMKDGTVLGPYKLRADALQAEFSYLERLLFYE